MDRRPLTEEELQDHLRKQLRHLRNSAGLYDDGDHAEAVRLGTTVYTLMHHQGQSKSLLALLGLRETIQYVDTGIYRDEHDEQLRHRLREQLGASADELIMLPNPTAVGLVTATSSSQYDMVWAPVLGSRGARFSDLKRWWEAPLIETSSGVAFSRHELTRVMRNQDGGSHVDPAIGVDYHDFRADNLGWQYAAEPGDWTQDDPPTGWHSPLGIVADASMRQIAWELEQTLLQLRLPWLT